MKLGNTDYFLPTGGTTLNFIEEEITVKKVKQPCKRCSNLKRDK